MRPVIGWPALIVAAAAKELLLDAERASPPPTRAGLPGLSGSAPWAPQARRHLSAYAVADAEATTGGDHSSAGGSLASEGGDHSSAGGDHSSAAGGHDGDNQTSHGPELVSADAKVIAYLMIFGVGFIMSMIWLINYEEAEIRLIANKMVCTACSVYCAVLVNQAVFALVFDQLLVGKGGRGLGWEEKDITATVAGLIGGAIFILAVLGLNFGCWFFRQNSLRLIAFSELWAHIAAWAGINAFGNLQQSDDFVRRWQRIMHDAPTQGDPRIFLAVVAIVGPIFLVSLLGGGFLRRWCLRRQARLGVQYKKFHDAVWQWKSSGGWQPYSDENSQLLEDAYKRNDPKCTVQRGVGLVDVDFKSWRECHEDQRRPVIRVQVEEGAWLEELEEAEKEAAALVLGYLTMNTCTALITHKSFIPVHGLHDPRTPREVLLMNMVALLFFLALVVSSCVTRAMGRMKKSVFNFRAYLAMTMAWCFERGGEWTMHLWFEQFAMARIWSAFALSVLCVVCVAGVKVVVDSTQERIDRSMAVKDVTPEMLESLDDYLLEQGHKRSVESEEGATEAVHAETEKQEDLANLHAALKMTPLDHVTLTMVSGFSVLVGLAWDIAFESAEELIVAEGSYSGPKGVQNVGKFFTAHPVICKIILACILLVVVLPGWARYIVPSAKRPWRHHFENIVRNAKQTSSASYLQEADESEKEE